MLNGRPTISVLCKGPLTIEVCEFQHFGVHSKRSLLMLSFQICQELNSRPKSHFKKNRLQVKKGRLYLIYSSENTVESDCAILMSNVTLKHQTCGSNLEGIFTSNVNYYGFALENIAYIIYI